MTQHKMSVWILGDQLPECHPALVAAEAAVGREDLRVGMPIQLPLLELPARK